MRRALTATVLVVAVLLGCGGDDDEAIPATTVDASPAASGSVELSATAPTPPRAAARTRDDDEVRRRVADIDRRYLEKYEAEVDAIESIGGRTRKSGEARIDDVIDQACAAKANGFPPFTKEQMGALLMLVGATLTENGHDLAGLQADVLDGQREIARLVDC